MPEPADDTRIAAAAGALIAQYGDDAAVIASLRAAEEAAKGDVDASDHWLAVAAVIEAFSDDGAAKTKR